MTLMRSIAVWLGVAASFAGYTVPASFMGGSNRATRNGGTQTGVAAAKRAARKRRNIRKRGGAA